MAPVLEVPAETDINNMRIFIGNWDRPNVIEKELKQTFLKFGEISYVKIPMSRELFVS